MPVYEEAKSYMRKEGNMTQWTGGYPSEEVILKDIAEGNHYIIEKDGAESSIETDGSGYIEGADGKGELVGVFTFIIGDDPTYKVIDGAWPNENPYGTIHRIASTGKERGLLRKCVDFCFGLIPEIRIDTHSDNRTMLAAIESLGFQKCGIIRLADGSPRTAFQKSK